MAYTTIKKPSDYFNTKLYIGNSSTQSITGVGFQPDFVWIKDRIGATSVYSHHLFNSIVGAGKFQASNLSDSEGVEATTLTSFDSDGFSLGSDASTNANSDDIVAWNWLASNTTASNTDGSITSTVSANTTSGFSIVSYTGTGANATIGHGLGVKPSWIVVKSRSLTEDWCVYHSSLTANNLILLNTTGASFTSSTWNSTEPTSTVFSLGSQNSINGSGQDYIAYCFAEKKGFSKFGSYTGNGNADGTFIYTGFKPAFVLIKATSISGEHWHMWDNKRSTFNEADEYLQANTSGAEGTGRPVDFLSNGFKWRANTNESNQSGATYIYMAFAEEPLVGDNPATAR